MLPSKSVLVALSGGADSVALLHIMCELSKKYHFKVYAAHINHMLRGEDADKDEAFSKTLADNIGITLFILRKNVREFAESEGISEELAGRKVRYDFFDKLMNEYEIEYTATAHHKNDNAETILMNFMRGSSIKGLSGIPYKRDKYIRPLLDCSRLDIEEYCQNNSLNFVTDKTNLETIYTRNKIRRLLIPYLQSNFNPNIVDTITKNAGIIAEDDDFISEVANTTFSEIVTNNSVSINELMGLHKSIALRVIRKMLENCCGIADISSYVIENIYGIAKKNKTGLFADITATVRAKTEYGILSIGTIDADCPNFAYSVKIGESKFIPELGYTVHTAYADCIKPDKKEYFSIPNGIDEIIVRNRRSGDIFFPSGMNGKKSIKSYMINKKIPKHQRSRTGLITVDDKIVWIIGYRRDNRFDFAKNGIKIWISY